jgi:hypothetical protein
MWGPKYTHFVDVWVAYRDLQNKFGLDHKVSSICDIAPGSATTPAPPPSTPVSP